MTPFESRLADAFERYTAAAPVAVDAASMARAATAAGVASHVPARGRMPRLGAHALRAILVGATILALVAGAALIGGPLVAPVQPTPSERADASPASTPGPTATFAGRFFITHASMGCNAPDGRTGQVGASVVDIATRSVQPVLSCENSVLLSPDGVHAAVVAGRQLELADLRVGSRRTIEGAEGQEPEALTWSPKGTYLHWLGEKLAAGSAAVFIGPLDDARRSPLPTPAAGGYYTAVRWSQDEQRVLLDSDEGLLLGDGDGTDLRPLQDPRAEVLAMSSDGSRLAEAVSREEAGALTEFVVAIGDPFEGARQVVELGRGLHPVAAAWSPDDSILAIATSSPPQVERGDPTNAVWLVATDGSSRRVDLPVHRDALQRSTIRWAPGGRHLAVAWHTMRRETFERHTYAFALVDVASGTLFGAQEWTPGPIESVVFSPDGARVVYPADGVPHVVNLDGSGSIGLRSTAAFGSGQQLVWLP
jgi:hypothetical protein